MNDAETDAVTLQIASQIGTFKKLNKQSALPDGFCCSVDCAEDGFVCRVPAGALVNAAFITFDFLLEGNIAAPFAIRLSEGQDGPTFLSHFAFINECQARVRLPLSATLQNRWMFEREGAWLKVICSGDKVDLSKVDTLKFTCFRKVGGPVNWQMTPIKIAYGEVEKLTNPLLPAGKILDELGQSTLSDWEGKCKSPAELALRLTDQLENADNEKWPDTFSRYGGFKDMKFESSGFFRTHHDGNRWWLVDPDGHPFWSTGLDCVRSYIDTNIEGMETALTWNPCDDEKFADAHLKRDNVQMVDFLRCNFIRVFGENWFDKWSKIAISQLKKFGFNTVANWSQWEIAAKAAVPYVRPLDWPAPNGPQAKRIFRDMPDVFDSEFKAEADHFARQLAETRDDPAFIGYFLMNEPTWGFASMTPAQGMLYNCEHGATRSAFAAFLKEKYADEAALQAVWGADVNFAKIEAGLWHGQIADSAKKDLEQFSTVMVDKLFKTLTDACRKVDPNHLNLGARYFHVPPKWAAKGMSQFDVFSVNGYRPRVDRELAQACEQLGCPAIIGEWHFGSLDAGLPATGIGHVPTQADRGKAYRIYLEDAAAQNWCVGVHYFTFYDQSAMGRFDGENYNIGFLDICHKAYPIADAARISHELLYEIATGKTKPFDEEPEYLERLFY